MSTVRSSGWSGLERIAVASAEDVLSPRDEATRTTLFLFALCAVNMLTKRRILALTYVWYFEDFSIHLRHDRKNNCHQFLVALTRNMPHSTKCGGLERPTPCVDIPALKSATTTAQHSSGRGSSKPTLQPTPQVRVPAVHGLLLLFFAIFAFHTLLPVSNIVFFFLLAPCSVACSDRAPFMPTTPNNPPPSSCNRTGALCICEPGFEGDACQRSEPRLEIIQLCFSVSDLELACVRTAISRLPHLPSFASIGGKKHNARSA